jgi:hypothetical protein
MFLMSYSGFAQQIEAPTYYLTSVYLLWYIALQGELTYSNRSGPMQGNCIACVVFGGTTCILFLFAGYVLVDNALPSGSKDFWPMILIISGLSMSGWAAMWGGMCRHAFHEQRKELFG